MIAPARAQRPGAPRGALERPSAEELAACPFCEGREQQTPPETFALAANGRAPDTPGWRIRVVPNLYPAFERQEVVIHTPRHVRSLVELADDELALVARAWAERWGEAQRSGFHYVHAIVNEGRAAGASLAHSHSQLVWLRDPPPAALAEDSGAFGPMLAGELAERARVVVRRDGLVLLCPYASRVPYEMLVAPQVQTERGLESPLLPVALGLVAEGLRRLHRLEGPVPLNVWLHDLGHWHVEVVPRLTVFAGIELGAGLYVNTLAPEHAAAALRGAGP